MHGRGQRLSLTCIALSHESSSCCIGPATAPSDGPVASHAKGDDARIRGAHLEVFGFLDAGAIPLVYYAKPYTIAPVKGSEKAYVLFREALEVTKRIGLAQVVIHTRQYMAAVIPHDGLLVVQLLRYEQDLKTRADIGLESLPTPGRATVR